MSSERIQRSIWGRQGGRVYWFGEARRLDLIRQQKLRTTRRAIVVNKVRDAASRPRCLFVTHGTKRRSIERAAEGIVVVSPASTPVPAERLLSSTPPEEQTAKSQKSMAVPRPQETAPPPEVHTNKQIGSEQGAGKVEALLLWR